MATEILKLLQPFHSFVTTFSQEKVHNMLLLMFDLIFKGMHIVVKFPNSSKMALKLVVEND
jgi:hypothetical protein